MCNFIFNLTNKLLFSVVLTAFLFSATPCLSDDNSNEPFGAVILDLTIKGGMGGEQTIRELLKIDPDVKAILSSGYFNDPVMADFHKYGFVGAMAKPYEKKNLKEALEKIFL